MKTLILYMKALCVACLLLCLACPEANARPKVALVLGGGGAKGAAEVGVLKYIEQSGVPIDMVVGTSIGSIVGGLYCVGYRSEQLDSMFRSQEWLSLFTGRKSQYRREPIEKTDSVTYIFGFPIKNTKDRAAQKAGGKASAKGGYGMLRGDSIVNMLEKMIGISGNIDFDSLPVPYRCVAVDMKPFEEVVLRHGNLAKSMRASMAIPLAFRPEVIDGRSLADGGLLNNLPVDVAKEMGADIIIAVDLSVNKHEDYKKLSDTFTPLKNLELLNILRWAIDRPDISKYHDNCKSADIYINPSLKGYDATDFRKSKIEEMIALGEEAGKKALPQLLELKQKIVSN